MNYLRELALYGLASAFALVVDIGLLFYLVRYCLFTPVAGGSVAFAAGAIVAYTLSVKLVFTTHRLHSRRIEFVIFCLLGLVGLAVNAAIIAMATWAGASLLIAKASAAGATFLCNFLLRRQILFITPKSECGVPNVLVE